MSKPESPKKIYLYEFKKDEIHWTSCSKFIPTNNRFSYYREDVVKKLRKKIKKLKEHNIKLIENKSEKILTEYKEKQYQHEKRIEREEEYANEWNKAHGYK